MASSRVVLVNTNEMKPPIAPIALDYLAGALAEAGLEPDVLDLSFAADGGAAIGGYFSSHNVRAVGLAFRNSDDCYWPSAANFVPRLAEISGLVRAQTDAPVILGGIGFSVFPEAILEACDLELGIQGEGESALPLLLDALENGRGLDGVPGLVRRQPGSAGRFECNPGRPIEPLRLDASRAHLDNVRYFREGGQAGVETKRGCNRACTYCADPLVKGRRVRVRAPAEVADEVESLLRQGIDALHLCDSEFNVPPGHALAVCEELTRRRLGSRVRWYTYASITPFSDELARAMRRAGCVGVDFGADSASPRMLAVYGREHSPEDIARTVGTAHSHGLTVMLDLLLGGPGEDEASVRETIEFIKQAGPDCAGAALGVRIYPRTALAGRLAAGGPPGENPNVRQRNIPALRAAPESLLAPTFYVSALLGENPARLVNDLIAGDERFFPPVETQGLENYNYNDNEPLVKAVRNGARGAYWDILRKLRASHDGD